MTSIARRASPMPASLNQRIREVEQRLAGRQRSTGAHSAAFGRNLRERLSSPITLLIAAGAGFALGQFSKRKRVEARAESDPPRARPSIFATLMEALTLASTVMAMLPALRRGPVRESEPAGEAP